jgi:hypothetical protein
MPTENQEPEIVDSRILALAENLEDDVGKLEIATRSALLLVNSSRSINAFIKRYSASSGSRMMINNWPRFFHKLAQEFFGISNIEFYSLSRPAWQVITYGISMDNLSKSIRNIPACYEKDIRRAVGEEVPDNPDNSVEGLKLWSQHYDEMKKPVGERNERYEHHIQEFVTGHKNLLQDVMQNLLPFFAEFDKEADHFFSNPDKFKIEKKAEGPPDGPLGQIVFGEDRVDDVPYEKNTELEQELYIMLQTHVRDNEGLDPKAIEIIKDLMDKNLYRKIFKAPKQKKIYRGASLSVEALRKLLKLEPGEALPKKGKKNVSFNITARKGLATSWTLDAALAMDIFGRENVDPGRPFAVRLTAQTDDNKGNLVDIRAFYSKIGDFIDFEQEDEVMAFGTCKGSTVEWEQLHSDAEIEEWENVKLEELPERQPEN